MEQLHALFQRHWLRALRIREKILFSEEAFHLLLAAGVGGYLAWCRFHRNFLGLRETMEELREDMLWLQEHRGTADKTGDDKR